MSVQEHQPELTRCEHCGSEGPLYTYYRGEYCSHECFYRYKGRELLTQIEHISQFCSSCYRPIRDIEPVPKHVHPDADGFQYPTPNTTIAIDDFSTNEFDRLERTRWSCTCGAVNADSGPVAELQNLELRAIHWNLWWVLRWLHERGELDAVSYEGYFGTLRDRPRDAELAVGKAVYGDA